MAPWEAVTAGWRGGHDDLLGVGRRAEKEKGWEEVADASEVATAGGSDVVADVAARAEP